MRVMSDQVNNLDVTGRKEFVSTCVSEVTLVYADKPQTLRDLTVNFSLHYCE